MARLLCRVEKQSVGKEIVKEKEKKCLHKIFLTLYDIDEKFDWTCYMWVEGKEEITDLCGKIAFFSLRKQDKRDQRHLVIFKKFVSGEELEKIGLEG